MVIFWLMHPLAFCKIRWRLYKISKKLGVKVTMYQYFEEYDDVSGEKYEGI